MSRLICLPKVMLHAARCGEWECSIYILSCFGVVLYSSCAAKCVALIVGPKIIIEKCIVTLFIISWSHFTLRSVYFDWIHFATGGIHLFRWYFASFGQLLPIIIIIIIAIEAYCECVCVCGGLLVSYRSSVKLNWGNGTQKRSHQKTAAIVIVVFTAAHLPW